MRTIGYLCWLSMLLMPTVCLGLLFSVEGNKPQPEANYKAWPKLVDVVNDPTRARLVWCNGNETLHYRGKSADLNRVIQKFARVESDDLQIVLRPALKGRQDQAFDWELHITAGIALAAVQQNGDTPVEDIGPTLTIFLSENIALDKIVLPGELPIDQISDLRQRYEHALKAGNQYAQVRARHALQALEADADRTGQEAQLYQEQIEAIAKWVDIRNQTQ